MAERLKNRTTYKDGDTFVIEKVVGRNTIGLTAHKEAERRIEATEIHQRLLPRYTLETSFEIREADAVNPETVLIRRAPFQENTRTLHELPIDELLKTPEISFAVSVIYLAYFKELVAQGRLFDCYRFASFGKNWPRPVRMIARPIISPNIMVAINGDGTRVFCDPDWYVTSREYIDKGGPSSTAGRRKDLLYRGVYLLRSAAFFSAWTVGLEAANNLASEKHPEIEA